MERTSLASWPPDSASASPLRFCSSGSRRGKSAERRVDGSWFVLELDACGAEGCYYLGHICRPSFRRVFAEGCPLSDRGLICNFHGSSFRQLRRAVVSGGLPQTPRIVGRDRVVHESAK